MTTLIIGIVITMVFSAFFSGMEIAFVSSNRLLAEVAREKNGLSQRAIDMFYRHPSNFLSTMLVGNTIGFHRGYCGHEMLPEYGLINMNGRLYDPLLGRFLSPDNYVQQPDNSQNFNRYSYCLNNPLKYVDPSGEWFGIDDFLKKVRRLRTLCPKASDSSSEGFGQKYEMKRKIADRLILLSTL